ncbi:MAG: hypothetical protein A2X76_00680 [Lysobacterales bacterium GWF1_69_6]|nr:MAG: hypothetical protein A2X76_00680 [Xanthomonadales bacterium GWF1_69_6]
MGVEQLGYDGVVVALGQGQQFGGAVGDAEDPAAAADPQGVATREQGGGGAGQGMEQLERIFVGAVDAVGRGDHQFARGHGFEVAGVDGARGVAGGQGQGAEAAVLVHRDAAVGGDPEPVAGVHVQVVDPDAAQPGGGLGVEGGELDAVETGQAGLGADPDITLAVLGDGQAADLRQAFLDAPAVADVMVEGLVRVQRRHAARRPGKREHGSQRQGAAHGRHGGVRNRLAPTITRPLSAGKPVLGFP